MNEHIEELKEIKSLLFALIDAICLEKEYDSIEIKCKDFDLAQAVCKLAHEEQDLYMWGIQCILEKILPQSKGILAYLTRSIRFKRYEHWQDHFDFNLYIKGYDKECQEFYCLRKIFKDVDLWYMKNNFAHDVCGYASFLDVFYIEV